MPLRLKALELHGYKTFAGQTVFEFAEGITAIVGPNGAGKSNIADALRWVLGEQSYGLLRGKKTEDMIFSGSEHRPRAGMASAEIILDNGSGWLPIEFSEVAVARRAYRDGHNEYVLNGQHVRLRDMNELLAAAGLSERTYTIVGQGLVDASLALKADERRRLFEEAAGVGLYRVRREEAVRRLESTRRNMERVEDIMGEIEPRLKTLERQSRRAKEYEAAQQDLRLVLKEWYGFHWHRAQGELLGAQENVQHLQTLAEAAGAELAAIQQQHSQLRERVAQLRSQLGEFHQRLTGLQEEQQTAGMALAVLDERRRALTESAVALSGERHQTEAELELGRQRILSAEQDVSRVAQELEEARTRKAAADLEVEAKESQRTTLQSAAQEAADRASALAERLAESRARLDVLEENLLNYRDRLDTVGQAERAAREALARSEAASAASVGERVRAEMQLKDLEAQWDGAKAELTRLLESRDARVDARRALASNEARLQAQLEILDEADRTLTGFADGARFLIEASHQNRLKAHGALGALLDIPADLETAIAAALGDSIDAVVLDAGEIDRALDLLEAPDAGRAVLIAADGRMPRGIEAPEDGEVLGVASDLIKAPPELSGAVKLLLSNTLIVRTRAGGRRLAGVIPQHGRLVTLQGEVFRGDGSIAAGRLNKSSALSRPRQKREIAALLADLESRAAALDRAIEAAGAAVAAGEKAARNAESAVDDARRDLLLKTSAAEQAAADTMAQRRALEWQEGLRKDLLEQQSKTMDERLGLARQAEALEADASTAHREAARLRGAMEETELEALRAQAAYWSTRTAVAEQALGSVHARRAELQTAVETGEQRRQDLARRLSEVSESVRNLEAERAAQSTHARESTSKILSLQSEIQPAQQDLESAEAEEGILEEAEVGKQEGVSAAQRSLAQGQIELVRRQEALESLRERIMDDFGLVNLDYAPSVEGPVPLPFEGLVQDLPALDMLAPETEEQLVQSRARLRRLGAVNPEAAREYETESERYSFMSAQIRDLRQAEQDLREVISELDELTRQEFSRTYAEVDQQFRGIFTRLFGGGSAHLELTDPDNLIETGIEIEARLPGRREQGLSLLSGGERSLTAIALVFALLKVSPTPLCVLDEVDAMLDEANVGRFRDLVAELSQDTQFIIITHNRNTVQAADFIYGVTMGRDSTSQIISLKLDEVSEEMLGSSRT